MSNFISIDVPSAAGTYTYISVGGVDNAGKVVGTYGSADGFGDSTFYGFFAAPGSDNGVPFNWSTASNTETVGITPGGVMFGDYTDLANRQHGFIVKNGVTSNYDIFLSSSTTIDGATDSGVIYGSFVDFLNSSEGFVDNNGSLSFVNVSGAVGTSVAGVNATETIVGNYADASNQVHGFVDVGGSISSLDVPGGADTSIVAINDAGAIVGTYEDSTDTQRGFVDHNGSISTLNLPGNVGISGINDAGEIVGYYTDVIGNVHGFTDINGQLATADVPGATETDVLGVTASGELYGYYDDAANIQHGFVGTLPSTPIVAIRLAPPQVAPYDLAGDGYSGVLWRSNGGGVAEWSMQGGVIESSGFLTYNGAVVDPGPSWNVAGVGDFDADGHADVLWRNSADGSLVSWSMNGTTIETSSVVTDGHGGAPRPDASWSVAGTGDFNGDGKADILWRSTGGELVDWSMNGSTITGGGDVTWQGSAVRPDASWSVAGVGDFNGDGKSDILWRNASGEVSVWSMNGSQVVAGSDTTANGAVVAPDGSWSVAGVGDFDGDGRSDVLWRSAGGSVAIWTMNGSEITSSNFIISQGQVVSPDASWHVVEVGDFNGDGKADILWRNDSGALSEWLMNGSQIASSLTPTSQGAVVQPDNSWQPKV